MAINKTFHEFATEWWQCFLSVSDAEDNEACRSSPSCPLLPDYRSSFDALPLLQDLTPRRTLRSSWDSHVGVWAPFHLAPLPATEQIASSAPSAPPLPPLCLPVRQRGNSVMESDFRRSDARFLLSPPTMGLKKKGQQMMSPDVFWEVSNKERPTMASLLASARACCSFRATKQVWNRGIRRVSSWSLEQMSSKSTRTTDAKKTNHSLSLEMWIQMLVTLWACVMGANTWGQEVLLTWEWGG